MTTCCCAPEAAQDRRRAWNRWPPCPQLQYLAGDLEADAAYYRIHFGTTLTSPEPLERVVRSYRTNFTPDGILAARAIEERLMDETWRSSEYDLSPKLARLRVPTLVIHGERDLAPWSARGTSRRGHSRRAPSSSSPDRGTSLTSMRRMPCARRSSSSLARLTQRVGSWPLTKERALACGPLD